MPLFRYQQDSINEAYAKRDKLREAGLTAFLVQKRRTGDLFLCVRADNEQAISDALAKRNPPDSSMPPSHYEELASRAIKRRKWSEAARHYRDAAAVTVGHNQAARYIEAAERMERRVDGQPAPRSEVVRGNPPRRPSSGPPMIAGYPDSRNEVISPRGKRTGWYIDRTVKEYRLPESLSWMTDTAEAVVLSKGGRVAVGLSYGKGVLLRAVEILGPTSAEELKSEAIAEAEHWLTRDIEDAEQFNEEEEPPHWS
jgi:hypothetical protein